MPDEDANEQSLSGANQQERDRRQDVPKNTPINLLFGEEKSGRKESNKIDFEKPGIAYCNTGLFLCKI